MFRPVYHSLLFRPFGIHLPRRPVRYYATIRYKEPRTDHNDLSTDGRLDQLNKLAITMMNNPEYDVWSMGADLLDLHVPGPVIRPGVQSVSLTSRVNNLFNNQMNHLKNVFSMYRMAKGDSFPGVHLRRALSLNLFRLGSPSDKAWVAPLRDIALETYKRVNEALAENDPKTLKKLTNSGYYATKQSLLRNRSQNHHYVWTLHSEVQPPKVVSIRAVEGNLAKGAPKFGNRLIIQALVRFDTMQTLQVFSKRGVLVSHPDASTPKRVTEYLVFEKKMWYDIPWMIKEQLYESST